MTNLISIQHAIKTIFPFFSDFLPYLHPSELGPGNGPRFTYVEEFNYGSYEETNYESITAITNPN